MVYEDDIADDTQVYCKYEDDSNSVGMNTPSRIKNWNDSTRNRREMQSEFNAFTTAETMQRKQEKQYSKGITVSLSYKKHIEEAV